MTWARLDDGFDSHPKILKLRTDSRRFTWVRIVLYTNRYDTAEIPANITEIIPKATPDFLVSCTQIGLIDIDETDGTMRVHDWEEYSARKTLVRERWKDNKRKQRGQTEDDTRTDPGTNDGTKRGLARAQARTTPTRPDPSLEEEPSFQTTALDDEKAGRPGNFYDELHIGGHA